MANFHQTDVVFESFVEVIGKNVSVTYQPRKNKTGIKKIVLSEYVPPPTTTSKPTTAADITEIDGSMDCTCQPNMTGMADAINGQMSSGRAIRYIKKEEEGQLFLDTYTETRDIVDPAGNTFTCLYSLTYDADRQVVFRKQSSVQCEPNTNGKQTVEYIVIEAIGKNVSVTHQSRKNKTGIKKIVLSDYVPPPTTTSKPTTA